MKFESSTSLKRQYAMKIGIFSINCKTNFFWHSKLISTNYSLNSIFNKFKQHFLHAAVALPKKDWLIIMRKSNPVHKATTKL